MIEVAGQKRELRHLRMSTTQREVLTFRAPPAPDGTAQIEEVGIVGEFGGGKSWIAALRALLVCCETPGYSSGFSAPTYTGLINGPLAEFFKVCPKSFIKKDRTHQPRDPHILLRNNHKIILYTGHGALDGPNLVQFWGDEIQDRSYVGHWANMAGRVRVKGAPRLNAQASGIAQLGYVASIFRNPPRDGRHLTKLLFPEMNRLNLAHGYVDMLKNASAGGRKRDPDGWMTEDGLLYGAFSKERNIDPITIPRRELRARATDLAVDFGARAGVSWWQPWAVECNYGLLGMRREMGQVCVDQLLPDGKDAEEIAKIILDTNEWNIVPGISTIALDPTAETDQVRHFRRAFPGVEIISHRGGFYWEEENGVRAVERAVLDAHSNVRMFVHPDLVGDPSGRGIVEMFNGYLRAKPKDKWFEHIGDTTRYQIQHRLPLPQVVVKEDVDNEIEARISSEFKPISPAFGEVIY